MKRKVLKAALRAVNAVLAVATVGMVCAFFASGIAWGVGAVNTWPDDLDGVHATELAHRKIAAAVAGQVCP